MIIKELLSNIKKMLGSELPSAKIYLVGESLRSVLLNKKPAIFEFFVETKDIDKFYEISPRLCVFNSCKFTADKKINLDKEIITVNCLYVNIDEILNNITNIQSFNNGFKDFNKGVIKLTEKAKAAFADNPSNVFTILNSVDETDFYIDPNTAYFIFTQKAYFAKIEKRKIFNFVKDILKKNHPRKFISYLNTFGISKELFDVNLVETPIVNHLKPNDVYELFSVLFDNIEYNELENFLVHKCGLLLRDVEHVLRISKIIRNIKDESDATAKSVLEQVEKNRVTNICRLLKTMGYKQLSKSIRKQKGVFQFIMPLCIDERSIRSAFGINDDALIATLMNIAKEKVDSEPEYNDKSKILLYLNSERIKLCQDQDQMF
jgi:tRNA nucleotidyltransferase/poly(A) polymerase